MSGYLYFPNNLKGIKDHIWADMISCKIFFPINGNSFQRKTKLIELPFIFYGSIRFVFETAFTSEQIAENRFGGLLEISDKFITKFNVFSYMILQMGLKQFGKFQNYIVWKKKWLISFDWTVIVCTTKVSDELLETFIGVTYSLMSWLKGSFRFM